MGVPPGASDVVGRIEGGGGREKGEGRREERPGRPCGGGRFRERWTR